jgi:hypothetical protein
MQHLVKNARQGARLNIVSEIGDGGLNNARDASGSSLRKTRAADWRSCCWRWTQRSCPAAKSRVMQAKHLVAQRRGRAAARAVDSSVRSVVYPHIRGD